VRWNERRREKREDERKKREVQSKFTYLEEEG